MCRFSLILVSMSAISLSWNFRPASHPKGNLSGDTIAKMHFQNYQFRLRRNVTWRIFIHLIIWTFPLIFLSKARTFWRIYFLPSLLEHFWMLAVATKCDALYIRIFKMPLSWNRLLKSSFSSALSSVNANTTRRRKCTEKLPWFASHKVRKQGIGEDQSKTITKASQGKDYL